MMTVKMMTTRMNSRVLPLQLSGSNIPNTMMTLPSIAIAYTIVAIAFLSFVNNSAVARTAIIDHQGIGKYRDGGSYSLSRVASFY